MTTPLVEYFHNATRSLRASATIVVLRILPPLLWTRSWNQTIPQLQQPKATGGLRWAGADTLAERIGCSRTGGLQGRQSAAANDDDTARVAVATTPANLGVEHLVPRARPEQRR